MALDDVCSVPRFLSRAEFMVPVPEVKMARPYVGLFSKTFICRERKVKINSEELSKEIAFDVDALYRDTSSSLIPHFAKQLLRLEVAAECRLILSRKGMFLIFAPDVKTARP
ncbi:unnamed protein product [Strongylus vulgaris]|uniref:Uncharacterized protein n=1 Tax=Strongylus vulgaris TaxID=40348 RepID=A0A3P7LTM8_STRVU|nr:unnamed protein product [Strongylus vulgaris]